MSLNDYTLPPEEVGVCQAIRALARRYSIPVLTAKAPEPLTPGQLEQWLREPLLGFSKNSAGDVIDQMVTLTTQIDPSKWAEELVVRRLKERAKADEGKYVFVDSYADLRFK